MSSIIFIFRKKSKKFRLREKSIKKHLTNRSRGAMICPTYRTGRDLRRGERQMTRFCAIMMMPMDMRRMCMCFAASIPMCSPEIAA